MFVCYPAMQFWVMRCNKLFGKVTERASVPPINLCHIATKYQHDRLHKLGLCLDLSALCHHIMLHHFCVLDFMHPS